MLIQEKRETKLCDIPIKQLLDFNNHPFIVDDETPDMLMLVDSIRVSGIVVPLIVREIGDGNYQVISGHRRKRAGELLGLTVLPCSVAENLTDDDAAVLVVTSNIQRTTLLPSEKAFAYKLLMEALNHQGKKKAPLTSSPVDTKLSVEEIELLYHDSAAQIYRYIRLTYLLQELLILVDNQQIKMRPAIELSYISKEYQAIIKNEIDRNCATPSHAQARRLRKAYEDGEISASLIAKILSEEKPNQKECFLIPVEKCRDLIPRELSTADLEEYIINALRYYQAHNQQPR